jgi:hypothetical protein
LDDVEQYMPARIIMVSIFSMVSIDRIDGIYRRFASLAMARQNQHGNVGRVAP